MLKETFLNYVELQRGARQTRDLYGTDHHMTKEAYEKANYYKRKMLDLIEQIESDKT